MPIPGGLSTPDVYGQEITPIAYLAGETDGIPHREMVLDDMLQLWLDNVNPAASPFSELFDDANLEGETPYLQIIYLLRRYLDTQPKFGPENQNLVDLLRSPAIAMPLSLAGQLQYIHEKWAYKFGDYLNRLLGSLDLLREEEKLVFAGPGPTQVLDFWRLGLDAEYSAPSAGPPPWEVYEVIPSTIFALGTAEPYGATRWRC